MTTGCMKPTKRRKNARNQGNKLQPDNNPSSKDTASAKAAHTNRDALFLEKVFSGCWSRTTIADLYEKNKVIVVILCASFIVCRHIWKYEITHCSYKLNDRKFVLWHFLVLIEWCIRRKKPKQTNKKILSKLRQKSEYRHRLFWVVAEVFWARQVWYRVCT